MKRSFLEVHHPSSLELTAAAVRSALLTDDPGEALRHLIQFLDDVRDAGPSEVLDAARIEPEGTGSQRWDALLGGVAEYASRRAGSSVPDWANAPSRFLRRSWFVIEDILGRPAPGLAAMAFVSAPAALAKRAVFLDRSSLVSV